MHSILFSFDKPPDDEREKVSDWHTAARAVESAIAKNSSIEPRGRGAWLLIGEDALPVLSRMFRAAEDWRVPYRVLFVQDATEWKANPNAKSTAGMSPSPK